MPLPKTAAAVFLTTLAACGGDSSRTTEDFDPGPAPPALIAGETMYNGSCAQCHGVNGTGSPEGPPLVDQVYRPSHHADISFHLAVTQGVAPHHWTFGAMPPVEGIPREQVDQIISYVRWLQRQAGIF